ncbi:hypothetical protein JXA02_04120 [candidate division KSB1 bacterium]|nr:hypothetical protein [candidate division KSB1 bacterium]RQW09114.1 MAG: hypothetical protein EH222_04605 [candidate division KSB1 bacterium]
MSRCQDIRQYIVQNSIAPIARDLQEIIAAHLQSCQACRQFSREIAAIGQAGEHARVRARPELKRFLIKRIRDKQIHQKLPDRIRHFLTIRVALYQAAFVALLLFFLVLASPRLKRSQHLSEPHMTPTLADTSLNVINLQQIIQIVDSQKVGSNLRADTVLAKILYTL